MTWASVLGPFLSVVLIIVGGGYSANDPPGLWCATTNMQPLAEWKYHPAVKRWSVRIYCPTEER